MMLWIASLALAAPDRVAAELTDVTGTDELRVSETDAFAAVLDGNNVHVVDLETWEVTTLASGCTAGGLALYNDGSSPTVSVGCDDGSVSTFTYADHAWSDANNVDLFIGTVYALEYGGDYLFAIAAGTGNAVSWTIDTSDWSTLEDAENGGTGNTLPNGNTPTHTAAGSGYVYVVHGSNSLSKIDVGTGAASDDAANAPPAGAYNDIATWSSSSNALLTDTSDDQMTIYSPSSSAFSSPLSGLDGPIASAISGGGTWVGIAEASHISFWDWDSASFGFTDTAAATGTVDTTSYDAIVRLGGYDQYLLAGTSGSLLVLTDLSWVDITSDHSADVTADTSLTFVTDTDGDYTVTVGSTEIDSGSATADTPVTVTIAVDDLTEGTNRVYVDMDDGGSDAVDITVDTPTPAAVLTSVSGGDAVLYLDLDAHGASDVDSLEVFIDTAAFTADDLDGMTAVVLSDGVTSAQDADGSFTLSADADNASLENGVTYYVAARWVAGTDAGELSGVLTGTPVPSNFVLCDMRDDGECPTCSTTPAGALALLGLMALAAVAVRRPRFAAVLVAAGVLAPSVAQAQEAETSTIPSTSAIEDPKDYYLLTKQRTTEVRFGPSSIDAPQFDVAYDRLITLHIDGGVQMARFVELNGGIGLTRPVGSSLLNDGTASGEVSRMNLFPISGGVTFRFDPAVRLGENSQYIDHDWYGMPVVPYFSAGVTAWPAVERKGAFAATDPLATSTRTGAVPGTWY